MRIVFVIKTICLCVLLIAIGRYAIQSPQHTQESSAYIWVIDPYQSVADLQQSKNQMFLYLQNNLTQPIGLILQGNNPIFLQPPTYDTGILRTYIESIQPQNQGQAGSIDALIDTYQKSHIFVSSYTNNTYNDIKNFAADKGVVLAENADIRKIGILSVLLILVLLI